MYAYILHAHQKLDRAAYNKLMSIDEQNKRFPSLQQILHFEGRNGPDAPKLKRAPHVQPWHFVDPYDVHDTDLVQQIQRHHDELVLALKNNDMVRGAFEAAWLAHAIVDGLTPAHHYPYEQELAALRGQERHTRNGLLARIYVQGEGIGQSIVKSFRLVGPKGLLSTHALFEGGAAAIILPLRFSSANPTAEELALLKSNGTAGMFSSFAKDIAELNLYGRFYVTGWTPRLARDIRRELAPRMVRAITLAWYAALMESS
ncbi:MAG TPA: hypothetical protein VFN56_04530 [Candidatus Saccharimonadales bacterium]|nr:hypothetical protein [Candidatus Saccharimonadales bacterium]